MLILKAEIRDVDYLFRRGGHMESRPDEMYTSLRKTLDLYKQIFGENGHLFTEPINIPPQNLSGCVSYWHSHHPSLRGMGTVDDKPLSDTLRVGNDGKIRIQTLPNISDSFQKAIAEDCLVNEVNVLSAFLKRIPNLYNDVFLKCLQVPSLDYVFAIPFNDDTYFMVLTFWSFIPDDPRKPGDLVIKLANSPLIAMPFEIVYEDADVAVHHPISFYQIGKSVETKYSDNNGKIVLPQVRVGGYVRTIAEYCVAAEVITQNSPHKADSLLRHRKTTLNNDVPVVENEFICQPNTLYRIKVKRIFADMKFKLVYKNCGKAAKRVPLSVEAAIKDSSLKEHSFTSDDNGEILIKNVRISEVVKILKSNDCEEQIFSFNKTQNEYVIEVEKPVHTQIGEPPRENCRVFFTGLVVGDEFDSVGVSEAYVIDECSEYVGAGEYPDNTVAFPNAVAHTFDGIAIDKKTRVIIYSEKNFQGTVLLDKVGPAIINNGLWKNDVRYMNVNTKTFKEPLQTNFPQSVREWSEGNMQEWSYGSLKITCEE